MFWDNKIEKLKRELVEDIDDMIEREKDMSSRWDKISVVYLIKILKEIKENIEETCQSYE